MALIQEPTRAGEFLLSEATGSRSRKQVVITGAAGLAAGAVLAAVLAGTATATAVAGNTGDGAMGAITVSGEALPGEYLLEITEVGANAGKFSVKAPDGKKASGTVGVAYDKKGLGFTLADGATDFVVGDQITIEVAETSRKYTAFDPAIHDTADAVLFGPVDASAGDVNGVAIVRDAEVVKSLLAFTADMSASEQGSALVELAKQGIIAR